MNVFIVPNGHHLVLHADHILLQLEELNGESLQSGRELAEGVNGLNLLEDLIDQLLCLAILSQEFPLLFLVLLSKSVQDV